MSMARMIQELASYLPICGDLFDQLDRTGLCKCESVETKTCPVLDTTNCREIVPGFDYKITFTDQSVAYYSDGDYWLAGEHRPLCPAKADTRPPASQSEAGNPKPSARYGVNAIIQANFADIEARLLAGECPLGDTEPHDLPLGLKYGGRNFLDKPHDPADD